ncbi:S53 family peptidase [Paludisphaera mucosa]|uniref:Peptidase S53 domain-containing protein n=1 Tax=Paludisphaera mucosa TaxID=3030827 RepID=A0ABT6FII8_9BACT|nr:hypothetical protein [Paludisphaera mucosa]MDG3007386.1 hypothetical protein [Paludisphaera mucosa]
MNMLRRRSLARRPRRDSRGLQVRLESLETRTVLSTTTILPSLAAYLSTLSTSTDSSATTMGPAVTNPTPAASALSPSALLSAYGFSGSSTAGLGTTIAIVGAYDNPTIQADLAAFSSYYGLAAASLTVVNQYGQTTNLPKADAGWSLETAMDVEWAHAAAPGARIVLVEAASASASDLMTAVQTASKLANVVSMSWGGGEWTGQTAYDTASYFANSNVTFVAASGDDGGASGVSWPASSPYVLSVGGTTLSTSGSESGWSASGSLWTGYSGSTGGVSRVESLPTYQASALGTRAASGRVVPDVASDANPSTGLAVYSTASGLGRSGWFQLGGTSAGAPVWAGLIADADQARAAAGKAALGSSQTLTLLYSLYGTSTSRSSSYAAAFHDVTSGSNFAGAATSGYDVVTGLGSPNASVIISAAAGYTAKATTVTTTPAAPVRVVRPRARARAHDIDDSSTATAATTADPTATAVAIATTIGTTATSTTATIAPPAATTAAGAGVTTILAAAATPAALPNQSLSATAPWTAASDDSELETPPAPPATESTPTPPQAAEEPEAQAPPAQDEAPEPTDAVPDRDPKDAAPAADPADEMEAWDEALAEVRIARPAAAEPGIVRATEDEEEGGGAPGMTITLGSAAFLWHQSIRNRARRDDDRRRFVPPVPSPN